MAMGRFVAVGSSGSISTSFDGATWAVSTTGTTDRFNSIVYGDNEFVTVML